MFESPQKTIQSSIHIQGKGLHSGIEGNLYLKPSDVNTGIVQKSKIHTEFQFLQLNI